MSRPGLTVEGRAIEILADMGRSTSKDIAVALAEVGGHGDSTRRIFAALVRGIDADRKDRDAEMLRALRGERRR